MKPEEYLRYDMMGLAGLIARREVSALEVLEAALERMRLANPRINAITLDLSERARKEAAGPLDGPLAGAPYLIKEHGIHVAGTATALGSALFRDVVQPADSALVAALRRAGVVIFGKTNVPELGLQPVTEPRLTGVTRNPWDLDRTPGGSSGGASAAVAAGIVPAAHGSDGGGSIRIPAACTGTFGLKPSRGRVSLAPLNEGGGGLHAHHAVTRSVRDSALLLDIVCRPQPGDPYWLEPPRRPFLDEVGRPPGALRIAFTTATFMGTRISDECAGAVRDAARLCESLGHAVEEVSPPGDFPVADYRRIMAANTAATLEAEARRRGRPVREDEIEEMTLRVYEVGKGINAADYILALRAVHAFGRRMAEFFQKFDVLLNAVMGSTPIRIGELKNFKPGSAEYTRRVTEFIPNTQVANVTGQPAMSVPLAWSADGLPIGIHFTARTGDEATLFRLAAQLEQASPWAHRRPTAFA